MIRLPIMATVMLLAAAMFLSPAGGPASAAETTIIHAGTLLAVPGQAPLSRQSIIITDGIITGIRPGYMSPDDLENGGGDSGEVKVIDLMEHFVMPGLMDMHVHLTGELGPRRKLDSVEMSKSALAVRGLMYARRTLDAGFTTVRNLGADQEVINAMRDGIAKGYVLGPRIIASGGISATGGHGDISGFRPEIMEMFTSRTTCNGPYDCRRAVRQAIKNGADIIKIPATGGVLSDVATGTGQQLTDDEMAEIVATAHGLGRKVAAHAHGAGGIAAALRAGVDSIEHGTFTDPAAIRLFKRGGAWLIPTMLAGETVVKLARETDIFSPAIKAKALDVGSQMMTTHKKAYAAGVKIAFGTDSGVSHHGDNAQEFLLMRQIGMSEMDMLVAATVSGAELIGMSDTLGTIEVGKWADIIATGGSPLENIEELLDVDFVMKGGRVAKSP